MSTAQKHRILRAISQEAKPIRLFADGHFDVSEPTVRGYVAEMERAGLLEHRDDDTLHITGAGLAEVNRPPTIAELRTVNIASLPVWQPKPWTSTRPGADDYKRCKSLA